MLKKWMRIGLIGICAAAILTGCAGGADKPEEKAAGDASAEQPAAEESLKIGITQIVEHPALDSARQGFIDAVNEAGYEGKVEFIEKNAQGDMPTAQIIAQTFVDDKVDMIYAIATPTAQAAFNATKDIPIVISAVTDPVAAGLVEDMDSPGTNVSGTSDEAPIERQLQLLSDLGIEAKTIGFIYNTSEKNSEIQLEIIKGLAEEMGMTVEVSGVTSLTEMEQALDVLLDKVDVLYTPTDNMVASAAELVTNKAIAKKIPVLAAEPALVEAGGLATCGVDYYTLGRQSGEIAVKVLSGEDISTLAVEKAKNPEVTINKKTADSIGITISDSLLESSRIIGEE